MFNINYVPEVICDLAKALNIGMSACFDYQKAIIQYRFWTSDGKYEHKIDLPLYECNRQDPPFDFTSFLVMQLTEFLNTVEINRQKEKEIEEYQKKDLENTKKVLNSIYGRKAFEERFGYLDGEVLLFNSVNTAARVLNDMKEIIKVHGYVTVDDYYFIAGATKRNFLNSFYRWTNLDEARIVKHPIGKYMIRFPKAIRVDDHK